MNVSGTINMTEEEKTCIFWSCELNQDKRFYTVEPQEEGRLMLLHSICLGEKAKDELHVVEVLPRVAGFTKTGFVPIASLRPSILPMVVMRIEFITAVTFQLRAGSGPVFLCGLEKCGSPAPPRPRPQANLNWEEDEEEEEEEEGEEEEEEEEDIEMEEEKLKQEEETNVTRVEIPVKQTKRMAPQKQSSVLKKKKVEKEEDTGRCKDKSPSRKIKTPLKLKKALLKK